MCEAISNAVQTLANSIDRRYLNRSVVGRSLPFTVMMLASLASFVKNSVLFRFSLRPCYGRDHFIFEQVLCSSELRYGVGKSCCFPRFRSFYCFSVFSGTELLQMSLESAPNIPPSIRRGSSIGKQRSCH